MSLDQLNLFFGPQLPPYLDTLGIAFVASAKYTKDNAVAGISAERYVKENYDHIHSFDVIARTDKVDANVFGTTVTGLALSMFINRISVGGSAWVNTTSYGPINPTIDLNASNASTWFLNTLNSKISIVGIYIADNNSWFPIITPGICWRLHNPQPSEPADSWIRKSWNYLQTTYTTAVTGDLSDAVIALCYTIPEQSYLPVSQLPTTSFPGSSAKYRQVIEKAFVVTPNSIKVNFPVTAVSGIQINGSSTFAGFYDGNRSDTYIVKFDDTGAITLNSNLAATDNVVVTYYTNSDFYIYTGYRNATGMWFPLDLNPEYGHFTGDWEYSSIRPSLDCLSEQITIYLQPTALCFPSVSYNEGAQQASIGLYFDSAFNYGETHFVRHIIRPGVESINPRQGDSPINTYGHAILGRNYFDEGRQYKDDTYSNKIPSMMPLGKFILSAPLSRQAAVIADIRQRGGGVPLDYNLQAINTQNEGVDTLRGYFDLGVWAGKGVQKYGVVEFAIDTSVLLNFTEAEIDAIIQSQVPPGIDYVINYTSV